MTKEGTGGMDDKDRTWAAPIEAITGAAGHLEGRKLTGPQQGFGQLWQKTYRIEIADRSPAEVISTWKANYGDFWPRINKFNAPVAGIKPGEVGSIDSMQVLSTGVVVIYADDTSFAFMTPEGHPFAGWITFSAAPTEAGSVAQVQLLIRASDPFWDIGFIFGAGRGEDWMWRHTLKALASHLGSDTKPSQELVKVDRSRLWANAGNLRKNAFLRRKA
jgi:hypothetical protein